MTYLEAKELALRLPWKTQECFSGPECWCELIVPEIEVKDKDGNSIDIVSSGAVSKDTARHIVEAHNQFIESTRDGFKIGDVVKKKSGKPFKCGYDAVSIVRFKVNDTDPKLRSCAVFNDGSVCNLDILEHFVIKS
jgi:hypothetical protein